MSESDLSLGCPSRGGLSTGILTDGQPGGDRNLPGRLGNAPASCFGAGAGASVADSRSVRGLPVGDVRGGRGARAGFSSYRRSIDHRLWRLSVWGSADRVSCPHDAPRPGVLAVAALVLLVAILAPVAREHGRELAKA